MNRRAPAQMIHEHLTHIRTPEGLTYVPRTYAREELDGVWEAWLVFHPTQTGEPTLATDRETSQSTRDAVVTWASGLERAYFEGAFARAKIVPSE